MKLNFSDIGTTKSLIDTNNILANEANKLIYSLRESMEEKGVIGLRGLIQSIEAKLIDKDTMGIYIDHYWKFQNYGVAGKNEGQSDEGYRFRNKKPPIKAITSFAESHGIRNFSMIYAFRNIIYSKGIKARHFVEFGIKKYLKS